MKKHNIPLFVVVTVLFWMSIYAYVPILTPYALEMGASLGTIGLIVAAYGLSQLLLRVPTGIISDRLGARRPFIILGQVATIAAALGMYLATKPSHLLLSRGLAGVAATTWVAFTVLFPAYFPPDQTARAMSILLFWNQTAQLLGTYIGGFVAEWWGWQASFILAGVTGVVALCLAFFIRDVPIPEKETVAFRDLLRVGKTPSLLVVSLLAALVQYVIFVTIYGFTPTYATAIGASKAQLGTLTLVSSIPTALAALLGGTMLTRHLGERRVIVGGFILVGITTLSIPFTKSLLVLNITQALGGVGRGAVFPVLMGMSIRYVAPSKRATAMGFFQSIYALGMTGGPAISGFLGNIFDLRGIFLSAGSIGLVSALLATWAFNTVLKDPPVASAQ